MALKQPESMDECFYFTNRTLEEGKGRATAWVFKPDCPKCGKAKMGKPIDEYCSNMNIGVHKVGIDRLQIVNYGDTDIFSLDFKFVKGGASEVKNYDVAVDSGGEGVETEITLRMENGDEPDEIIVYPVLLGNVVGDESNSPFVCLDNGVVVD